MTSNFRVYESFYILTIEIVGKETKNIEEKKDEKNEEKQDIVEAPKDYKIEEDNEKGPTIAVEKAKEKEINE